jgi:hypothetical protein
LTARSQAQFETKSLLVNTKTSIIVVAFHTIALLAQKIASELTQMGTKVTQNALPS